MDDDPISTALSSRRIPHGRTSHAKGRSKGATAAVFDPRRAAGLYDVRRGASNSKGRKPTRGAGGDGGSGAVEPTGRMEIHGLTPDEDGLLGTLDVGGIRGMFVLAGSRAGIAKIVRGLEREGEDGDENFGADGERRDEREEGRGDDGAADVEREEADGEEEEEEGSDADEDGEEEEELSSLEKEDARLNRRAAAFAKNSFRNPKFWMRWRGIVEQGTGTERREVRETNKGYLVFSSNDCADFRGTITCDALRWFDVGIVGHKVTGKARDCPVSWSDF